jgi:hypothetical protein
MATTVEAEMGMIVMMRKTVIVSISPSDAKEIYRLYIILDITAS